MRFAYRAHMPSAIACVMGAFVLAGNVAMAQGSIRLEQIGTYASGVYDEGAAEIVDYDHKTQRLFVVNAQAATIDVLDLRRPNNPRLLFTIDVTPYGAGVNSVSVDDGVVAVAVEDAVKQNPGSAVFFSTSGRFLNKVKVGALPDMITFSPNGRWVLVANEGEPNSDYTNDPKGSVSIIDMSRGASRVRQSDVCSVDFREFNRSRLDPSIRIYGPNATVAQDIEPEYIAISEDSKTAYVTLQENNAMAIIDIRDCEVKKLVGLGFKNHNKRGNGLDASDRDNAINIANWPLKGMYLPDAISAYEYRDKTYLVTANEGDAREYDTFVEEARVGSLKLDSIAFPNAATLRNNANLGRLNVTKTRGDVDNDGDYDELYSLGGRSFSIWSDRGELVFDSGDDFERITAAAFPANFNSDNAENGTFDNRSDNKGPEPEALAIGTIGRRTYAFIGLERISGVMVYDITKPNDPEFVQYINNRDFAGDAEAGTAGDLGPEGMVFISADDSPNCRPLLVVSNEISGTTTVYEIDQRFWWKENMENADEMEISGDLSQNFPNPASTTTSIPFTLNADAHVAVKVLDMTGTEVATLVDAAFSAGEHTVPFQTTGLPAGTYFYRLDVNGVVSEMMQLTVAR